MKNTIAVLTVLVCMLFAAPARVALADASESQSVAGRAPLLIGYVPLKPFAVIDEQGEATGYFADLMKAMLDQAGYDFELKEFPAARYYRSIVKGEIEVQFVQRNVPVLEQSLRIYPEPLFILDIELYWMPETAPLAKPEALSGQSLIAIHGFYYAGLLDKLRQSHPDIVVQVAPDYEAAVRMLAAGRADYLMSYRLITAAAAERFQVQNLQSLRIGQSPYHLGVHNSLPDGQQIMDRLYVAYRGLVEQGFMQALEAKYSSTDPERQ